jgi:hypothetical protein
MREPRSSAASSASSPASLPAATIASAAAPASAPAAAAATTAGTLGAGTSLIDPCFAGALLLACAGAAWENVLPKPAAAALALLLRCASCAAAGAGCAGVAPRLCVAASAAAAVRCPLGGRPGSDSRRRTGCLLLRGRTPAALPCLLSAAVPASLAAACGHTVLPSSAIYSIQMRQQWVISS